MEAVNIMDIPYPPWLTYLLQQLGRDDCESVANEEKHKFFL